MLRLIASCWLLGAVFLSGAEVSLFNGSTFAGWEGDTNRWWRIQEGALVGGSLQERIPRNDFLASTENYTNFVLRLQFKLLGSRGFINSGVQIRSQRVPDSHEMRGYQCDLGDPNWWGSLYDEARRNRVLAQSNLGAISEVLRRNQWNEYVIRAEGGRIRTWINGVLGVDYLEPDETLPQWGRIGFQIHGGGAAEAWFKDIRIEQLPATKPSPLTSEEQLHTFILPQGFDIELVAAEPDLPKPITVAWDDRGRLWTITAVEYPVDANESPAQAEALYANPGRDRVLIFDGTNAPQVFAEGLAIPLGLLPYGNGALVHHGSRVVYLRDTDGDGKADRRDVVLEGFGTQDSHLMPHQFTRAPGGWIYLAQGAFNYSKVRLGNGTVIQFDQTKLARFRPDGSAFEVLTHGPCNIWGLVINRFGETFIQEANDYGYPVIPFQPGINIPGCGDRKFRPYAPVQPPIGPGPMGGTGLSGLALSEGTGSFPGSWREAMFVANPITRSIQTLRVQRAQNGYSLERLPDLVQSADPWFRPVAIHFGPDGALYIVDWYNKIISHNEVPRTHPDRDKARGRLWRVRHREQPREPVPNVAAANNDQLIRHLASDNTWEWRAALNQIEQRKTSELVLRLADAQGQARTVEPAAWLIRSLWAMENLNAVDPAALEELAAHPDRNVRREAVRAAAALPPERALGLILPLVDDPDHQVRAEVLRTAARRVAPWTHLVVEGTAPDSSLSPAAIDLLVRMIKPALPDPHLAGPGYERAFERYLIRAFLESNPIGLMEYLSSADGVELPWETRSLAALALPGNQAARLLARSLSAANTSLGEEETVVIIQHHADPEVAAALSPLIQSAAAAESLAGSALKARARLSRESVAPLLERIAGVLLRSEPRQQQLAMELIGSFRLENMESAVAPFVRTSPELAIKTLAALRGGPIEPLHQLATDPTRSPQLRNQAIHALAVHRDASAAPRLLSIWPALTDSVRRDLTETMAGTRAGALTLLSALESGVLTRQELSTPLLEKMRALLPNDASMQSLWQEAVAARPRVLRLEGDNADYARSGLTLEGPFTVETWVRLDPEISNQDGILGAPGMADFNFHQGQFRVWMGAGVNDVVVAQRKILPDTWTHLAVTRDEGGLLRVYINGELDGTSVKRATQRLAGLDIGRTIPSQGGTAGWFAEYRVWDRARGGEELLTTFDQALEDPLPGLVHRFGVQGTWPALSGKARVEPVATPPPLITSGQAAELARKLDHYKTLSLQPANLARGRDLFTQTCLNCHQAGGQGAAFAPNLDGVGLRPMETLLRALLTPNAAVESGYRTYRVETKDGEIHDGFLAERDSEAIILRQPNAEPARFPVSQVKWAGFLDRSMMPEGLLEAFPPDQARDLLGYLRSMRSW